MSTRISQNHPLRKFFFTLTEKSLSDRLGWRDLPVVFYISNLLVDFTHVDDLFKIQSSKGKRLEEVGEMLLEADVLLAAGSFEREREVHRHIGDFTLFLVGMFQNSSMGVSGVPSCFLRSLPRTSSYVWSAWGL